MAGSGRKNADATLLLALAAGKTVKAAAAAAAVAERTVYRRLEEPAFQRSVAKARAAFTATATARLTAASTEAVATLRKLLRSESDTVRLAAARSILELGAKMREVNDLEQRILALEAQPDEAAKTN